MKIGVFGGTFDPVHLAHLVVAECARDAAGLDKVIFLPAPRPPHKNTNDLTGYHHRVEMVRRAIDGRPEFVVSDIENRLDGPSYTTRTLEILHDEYPGSNWFLIMGADSLRDLHTWRDPERLCTQARFIVFPRSEVDTASVHPSFLMNTEFLNVPYLDIAATDLRERVRTGRTLRYLVPDAVIDYIERNGLYR
jgi:nicotinate-nucleotide adenylyltransferase